MNFEKFLCAASETLFLRAGPRIWKSENQYEGNRQKGGKLAALFLFAKPRKEETEQHEIA